MNCEKVALPTQITDYVLDYVMSKNLIDAVFMKNNLKISLAHHDRLQTSTTDQPHFSCLLTVDRLMIPSAAFKFFNLFFPQKQTCVRCSEQGAVCPVRDQPQRTSENVGIRFY